MNNFSKFELGAFFALLSGAVWLGALTTKVEFLQKDYDAVKKEKEKTIYDIQSQKQAILAELQTQVSSLEGKLNQLNQTLSNLKIKVGEASEQTLNRIESQTEETLVKIQSKKQPAVSEVKQEIKTIVVAPVSGGVIRHRLKIGGFAPEMVRIPAGSFRMGDATAIQGGGRSSEKPVHDVSVEMFFMGKYEITFAEYDKFAEASGREKPSDSGWRRGNRPVINVSWHDAVAYAEWLSDQTGKQYRLPTEAEWEYAARAGTKTSRYWGNNPDLACSYANVYDNTSKEKNGFSWTHHNCTDGYAKTAPVGNFQANKFGLFDMLGNVWEWTCSEYENRYNGKEKVCDSKNNINFRVLRGGSWDDEPDNSRVASRDGSPLDYRLQHLGFRVVSYQLSVINN